MIMQVARTKENLAKCKCVDCPSYSLSCKIMNAPENLIKRMENLEAVDHYEKMFCAFEKSKCINEVKECICADCPVHDQYLLKKNDYCVVTGGE